MAYDVGLYLFVDASVGVVDHAYPVRVRVIRIATECLADYHGYVSDARRRYDAKCRGGFSPQVVVFFGWC